MLQRKVYRTFIRTLKSLDLLVAEIIEFKHTKRLIWLNKLNY